MRHEARKYLLDIRESYRAIRDFCHGRSLQDLHQDRMFRRALEREFEILGEAVRQLAHHHPGVSSRIPDAKSIIGLRNVLAHAYDKIDADTLWGIVEGKLGGLGDKIDVLISEALVDIEAPSE